MSRREAATVVSGILISLHTFRSSPGHDALHTCLFVIQCLFSAFLFFFSFLFFTPSPFLLFDFSLPLLPVTFPLLLSGSYDAHPAPRGSINHHGVSSITTCCCARRNTRYYIAAYYLYYIIKYWCFFFFIAMGDPPVHESCLLALFSPSRRPWPPLSTNVMFPRTAHARENKTRHA